VATPKSPASPLFAKALRYVLISFGATLVISGVVNIAAAWQLVESAEEQALGVTHNEIIGWFALLAAMGVALIVTGLRRGK
jgi:hypothetical protein